jgi:hypothetical protein
VKSRFYDKVRTLGVLYTSRWGIPGQRVPSGTEGQVYSAMTNSDGVRVVELSTGYGRVQCAESRVVRL